MKIIRYGLALLLFQSLCACDANSSPTTAKRFKKDEYNLAITGYNYTSRYIDQFSVNGVSGGNIFVSSPTSGGGGSICCSTFFPDVSGLKMNVRWQSGACRYVSFVSEKGEKTWSHHLFFKEREVTPVIKTAAEPTLMEIHIYPDDHVEAVVTSAVSAPRIKLQEDRDTDPEYPRCPNDQKPR